MKSTRRWFTALIIGALLVLATAMPAFAQGPGEGGRPTEEDVIAFVCGKASVAVAATDTDACD